MPDVAEKILGGGERHAAITYIGGRPTRRSLLACPPGRRQYADRFECAEESVGVRIRLITLGGVQQAKADRREWVFAWEVPSEASTVARGIVALSREHRPLVNSRAPQAPHRVQRSHGFAPSSSRVSSSSISPLLDTTLLAHYDCRHQAPLSPSTPTLR